MPALVKEPPQERRGLDYASLSFFSSTAGRQEQLVKGLLDLFDQLWPTGSWQEGGRSAHFQSAYSHVTGSRIELTVPGGEGKNPGVLLLTLPGAAFYLQPSGQAAFMLWSLSKMEGFRHFTRLDFQSTELSPSWDARRVISAVEEGQVWVKGMASYRLWAERQADQAIEDGATLYWGSPRSDRQCRTYDKAAQSNWSTPAIRDEVQLRRGWAKSTGQQLVSLLESNLTTDAMDDAIKDLAAGVINQHLQYWTLNGANPKEDKNWMRKAEPADWFADRIGRQVASVRKAPRPVQDLEATVSWGVQQYGRYLALLTLRRSKESGLPLDQCWAGLWDRCYARLSDEDVEELVQGLEGPEAAALRAEIEAIRNEVAFESEHANLP